MNKKILLFQQLEVTSNKKERVEVVYSKYPEFVEEKFYKCFLEKGYLHENPVKITSRVDSSVTFIGSAISPMKKYVLNKTVGEKGRFIIQNSIRTRALKKHSEFRLQYVWFILQSIGRVSRALKFRTFGSRYI